MKIFQINRETETGLKRYEELFKTDSWLFRAVEDIFNKWIENSNPAMEYEEMYFGDDACREKVGAIQAAIEQIFEVMDEYNLPFIFLTDKRLDLETSFTD